MAESPEDRKPDFSNFPRGAIGIKGLPVNRNTRLPSIRSPRDLTLGAQPKRTFTPNIPVRREKRSTEPGKDGGPSKSDNIKSDKKAVTPKVPDRGRGRGKSKANIVQTEGAVFGGSFAAPITPLKAKPRESDQRSVSHSKRESPLKAEKVKMSVIMTEMDRLLRDDFIDDGDNMDDDKLGSAKPIIFPIPEKKKEDFSLTNKVKTEATDAFSNQDFAKEMGYDVKKISEFIKKEKCDPDELPPLPSGDLPQTNISEILKCATPQLLLLRFPQCVTTYLNDDQQKQSTSMDTSPNEQKNTVGNLSSLPEGHIGKFQVMKSGHARLVIGSLHYDLDSISNLKSKHEIVSVRTETDSGDMTILGHVKNKLNFAPDIENILS